MAEVFPASWLQPRALPWVLDLLRALPLGPRDRKRTLEEWAKHANVKVTAEMVARVTGWPVGGGEEQEGGGRGGGSV